MLVVLRVFYVLIILNILKENAALVELPHVEDNDILNTELIIRFTANKLFSIIKLKGVKQNPKLKQYGLIHNYFVSLTLKDYKNLKEIAGLTRVDKKPIGNSSINFMDLINEILNGDIGIESNTITSGDTFSNEVGHYIDDYSQNAAYLKETYGNNSPRVEINKKIMEILENDERFLHKTALRNEKNNSNTDSNILLDENEFWFPDEGYRRIFKGQRTRVKMFPFMASIHFFNNFQCGGSIIKDDLVITAGSCLQLVWNNRMFRENPSFLSVRIGSNYYEGGGEKIAVLEVYFYPAYDPTTLRNNIALMRLVRKIRFKRRKDSRVKKINIDRHDSPLPMSTSGITIVGWGAKLRNNVVQKPWDNKISFAVLDVYPLQDCQDTYSKTYVTRLNFCAGKISTGSGACTKDVGGPGIVYGNLTGIISFGSPVCGTPDAPTVFTKVGHYSDWIEEIMEQEKIISSGKKFTTTTTEFTIFIPDTIITEKSTTTTSTTTQRTTDNSETSFTLPHPVTPIYNQSKFFPTPYPEETKKGRLLFREFLKTMFESKEIEEYLESDNDEKSQKNNAEMISIRQEQLKEKGANLPDTPKHFTHLLPIKKGEPTENVLKTISTTESLQGFERVTKLDELRVYGSEIKENNEKPEKEDVIATSEEKLDLNHIVSEEAGTKKESEEDVIQMLDDFKRQKKIVQSAPWKKDEVDMAVYNIFKSDEFEGRKEADTDLAKLVDNIDIQEEIKSIWSVKKDKKHKNVQKKLNKEKKIPKKLIKHKKVSKKLNEDKNNSIFTFMYVSDSEKDKSGVKLDNNINMTETMIDTNESESDKIDLFSDAENNTKLEDDSSNSMEDLNLSDEIQSTNVTGLSIDDKTFKQDLTYRKTKNESLFGDELSKKVLLDILSEIIDYQNSNKTIKT